MATDQQVSGSTSVNPRPNPPKIKDSAIHYKKLSTQKIRDIIVKSTEDDTDPEASETKVD